MTLVYTMLSASVDGYVSGRGARAGLGLGDGFRIFDWLSDHGSANRAIAEYGGTRTDTYPSTEADSMVYTSVIGRHLSWSPTSGDRGTSRSKQ